ncbi:MAG: hypothetical protein ACREH4_10165 [Vitreimonas sp.]
MQRTFAWMIAAAALALAAAACQSAVRPDASAIAPWTSELSSAQPREPFAAVYNRQGRVLLFIGAHHENRVESSTFRLIADTYAHFPIDTLITEGSPYSDGASPARLLHWAARQRELDGFVEGGETVPAVRGAVASGATLFGGEPDDADIQDRLLSMGFGAEDVLGFYVLRMIPQWTRERRIEGSSDSRLEPLVADALRRDREGLGLDASVLPDTDAWLHWYAATNGKRIEDFEPREAGPLADGPYGSNRINAAIGRARDAFLLETMANHFNAGENILIVYGKSHLMQLRPALDRMLGPPCYVGSEIADAVARCRRR